MKFQVISFILVALGLGLINTSHAATAENKPLDSVVTVASNTDFNAENQIDAPEAEALAEPVHLEEPELTQVPLDTKENNANMFLEIDLPEEIN